MGATGYIGLELLRLLVNHPHITIKNLVSSIHNGEKISTVWPHLQKICDQKLQNKPLAKVAAESDFVFLALPHTETQKVVAEIIHKTKIIDLSGDFRLQNVNAYQKYYGQPHILKNALPLFIYGLPEKNKKEIAKAQNIANPGCFAITCQLALLPLKGLIENAKIVAITGSSGAGKTPKNETHHPLRNHNLASYKIGVHQHIPEIIQTLGMQESQLTLVPTSGPFTRGIHLTAFVECKRKNSAPAIKKCFEKTYADSPFVRIKEKVQLTEVVGSNFCDLSVAVINNTVIVQAVIDNLVKGAAGTAIQNMNLMCGLDETTGLNTLSPLFP